MRTGKATDCFCYQSENRGRNRTAFRFFMAGMHFMKVKKLMLFLHSRLES